MINPQRPERRVLFAVCLLVTLALALLRTTAGQDSSQTGAVAQGPPTREDAARTEFHRAARTGKLTILRFRLRQGMNPDIRDREGRTPLMEAVKGGRKEAVRLLLTAGANVNAATAAGRTPLIEAAEWGRPDVARLLVDAGADLNASQRGYGTVLETAERNGHLELAAMLRQAGARSTGRSVGDKVCVRPWQGNGYCGIVEEVNKTSFRIRVTELVGCANGCEPKAECSDKRAVGGADGIQVGNVITTPSWCLTHTGVQP
jgi:ankyrin repeat protein